MRRLHCGSILPYWGIVEIWQGEPDGGWCPPPEGPKTLRNGGEQVASACSLTRRRRAYASKRPAMSHGPSSWAQGVRTLLLELPLSSRNSRGAAAVRDLGVGCRSWDAARLRFALQAAILRPGKDQQRRQSCPKHVFVLPITQLHAISITERSMRSEPVRNGRIHPADWPSSVPCGQLGKGRDGLACCCESWATGATRGPRPGPARRLVEQEEQTKGWTFRLALSNSDHVF
ncbi:hypothetical protein BKA80DRAFT_147995 [Phyllosticta citrichinensis]